MLSKVSELLVAIAALCVAVVLLGVGVATADPTGSPTVGTIHLVKYDKAELETDPTGVKEQKLPDGAAPIAGITFTLTPLLQAPGIENVANAAVIGNKNKELEALRVSQVEAALADPAGNPDWKFGDTPLTGTTDTDGAITWEDIPLGVYLLQEEPGSSYHRSPSALVFLPTSDKTKEPKYVRWLMEDGKYVTWVYPKNSLEENIKTVTDDGVTLGGTLTYTVSMSVPAVRELSDEEKAALDNKRSYNLNDFGLWDNLDKSLTFHKGKNEVTVRYGVNSTNPALPPEGAESLLAEDFVVQVFNDVNQLPEDPGAGNSGQKVVVALTSSGLNKVAQAKKADPDTRVFISFKPTLTGIGIVANKAKVHKGLAATFADNNAQLPFNPPAGPDTFETNTVVSAWGAVNVTKTDVPAPGKDPVRLKGAKFAVRTIGEGTSTIAEGTTDEQGKVTLSAVQASDLRNGGIVTDPVFYALVETQAPAGFKRGDVAIRVTFVAAEFNDQSKWKLDENGVVIPTTEELVEEKQSWYDGMTLDPISNEVIKFDLPRTGGLGVGLFLVVGGVFLGGAWLTRRRKA